MLFALFAVLGLAIQTAIPHLVPVGALMPNLMVILAVDLGLRHHGATAVWIAFLMGYASDSLGGSRPGLNAFMTTLVFLVSYEISSRLLVTNAFVGAMVVFFGVLCASLGGIAISAGLPGLSDSGGLLPRLMLQALISAVLAPFIFSLLAGCKRLIGLPAGPARE